MGALDLATTGDWKTVRRQQQNGGYSASSNDPNTKHGYDKSEVISALQKCIRRGREQEALFWAQELMESDEAYRMWRRLVVIAAEDVGLADPTMTARIMTMKQAHDFAREANIPFQAIMMLCRAPKNREADDASWFYQEKMKTGWRIPIPPEAVDGHTRRGRTNLYRDADREGTTWENLFNVEFFYDAALLRNYVPVETDGEEEKYRKALMQFVGLDFETYDIDTAKKPRRLSGRGATRHSPIASGVQKTGGVQIRATGDPETGEERTDAMEVQSFTDPEIWYTVEFEKMAGELIPLRCSCPAFEHDNDRQCKHMMAFLRAGGKPT